MGTGWTIATLLGEMRKRGDAPAVLALRDGRPVAQSHRALAEAALALGAGLRRIGLRRAEPVGLIAPNGPDWVTARLGIAAAGGLAVALDELSTEDEIAAILRDSACRRALASPAHAETIARLFPELELHVIAEDGPAGWRRLFGPAEEPVVAAETDEAMLVYTSGTTGDPKPFALTYANIAANVGALTGAGVIGTADRVLLPLPLHHVYPLIVGVLTPLAAGAAIVFPESVGGADIATAMREGRASVVIGVPRLYAALLDGIESRAAARGRAAATIFRQTMRLSIGLRDRLGINAGRILFRAVHRRLGPDLRILVSGGAKLEAPLIRKLQGLGWRVLSGYGLAETASIFTGNLPARQRIGSEGLPLDGGRIRIAGADESGTGEIQLAGPSVFSGYRRAEANRDVFTDDGWFRTGDLGRLDADGYLYVTGRAKDVIVLGGGKNVFPEALEKHYGASPYIREIAVLERKGALVALVLPDLAALQAEGKTRPDQAIRVALASAAQRLPSFQHLAGFALVREPLPRTRLGKYQRFRLPALYESARAGGNRQHAAPAAPSEADRALLARPPAREILALLKRRYPDAEVTLDASPQLDLGLDSLEWMGLAADLENRFGVRIDDAALARITTVRELLTEAIEAATHRTAAAGRPATADRRWIEPPGPALRLLGLVVYWLNRLLMRSLFRLRTRGVGAVPSAGPVIVVANHVSDLDPLAMAAALPWRQMRRTWWGGDAVRLFGSAPMRALCRAGHIFPVDELAPGRALDLAVEVLRRGDALIWFPESWRSPDGTLQDFLPGVGLLVARSGATAVPAFIEGTFQAMPRDRRLPRLAPIEVRFGPPVAADAAEASPQEIAARLRNHVAALARPLSSGSVST
ncbi:MAG: long-chain-fatty-acid--CoA ligase [Alphaproteobacteria bacterium]|nr:MAG: long-chain-fatty-acid--CoA ligase [Alphaproteobacteria bacterium]